MKKGLMIGAIGSVLAAVGVAVAVWIRKVRKYASPQA